VEVRTNLGPTWAEIEVERNRREDEAIARRYFPYKHLGRGHLREDLCNVRRDW
jgi:hypothetical protein